MLSALVAVVLLAGCASRESTAPVGSSSVSRTHAPDAAEMLRQSGSRARTFEQRLGLAVAAADLAAQSVAKGGTDRDRLLYNDACVSVAVLSRKVSLPATLVTPAGTYRLEADRNQGAGRWNTSYFSDLIPTAGIKNKTFVAKQPPSGFGGALVGVHRAPNPRDLYLPRVGVSAPVTAVVNIAPAAGRDAPRRATLALYDPSKSPSARIAGAARPLGADFSAPFGYYPSIPNLGILGALRPERFLHQEGLFLAQPYDPEKIPLVFIHGLMSMPHVWLPVMADIEADPLLRGKFQFWVFGYPTGNPIGYSALQLREALDGVYKVYPKTRDMVVVNHSLGGVITHLQIISPGEKFVRSIFKDKAPEILALPDSALLKRALVYDANPRIERVVFVAAPHRGAPMAINAIGDLGAALIRLPGQMVNDIGKGALQVVAATAGMKTNFVPNGVSALSPKNPLLLAMNTLPVEAPFHSIIGVAGKTKTPLEKTSDTVVPYWSSHLEGALSEKIVPYPHEGMFQQAEALVEIKRILNLHLAGSDGRR
jgi:pimeloyl-ACP methyl ester carboxylesterase